MINPKVIEGIFNNACPNCGEGKVFTGFLKMNKACLVCHLKIEREPGYFLGAVSFSYGLGIIVAIPVLLIMMYLSAPFFLMAGMPSLALIIALPFLNRLTRLAWLHMDYFNNPADESKDFILKSE